MRSAGWRQGGHEADKLIRERPDVSGADAKGRCADIVTSNETALRGAGATDDDLQQWGAAFVDAFAGKIERHLIRYAERERKRALWRDGRAMLKSEDRV